eukprot:PhM_4_TR14086/c5_g4_i1/m.107054
MVLTQQEIACQFKSYFTQINADRRTLSIGQCRRLADVLNNALALSDPPPFRVCAHFAGRLLYGVTHELPDVKEYCDIVHSCWLAVFGRFAVRDFYVDGNVHAFDAHTVYTMFVEFTLARVEVHVDLHIPFDQDAVNTLMQISDTAVTHVSERLRYLWVTMLLIRINRALLGERWNSIISAYDRCVRSLDEKDKSQIREFAWVEDEIRKKRHTT